MRRPRIITLTTDFGLADNFVGQAKGAALAVDPDLRLVDLCHEIPPGDIACGAYVLETGCSAFPPGTIHVAVVDPGVGGSRRPLAVSTADYLFVGPDNGVLGRALRRAGSFRAHLIEAAHFLRPSGATTFDGRDRFAPAAAWLARGAALEHLGPVVDDLVGLEESPPAVTPGSSVRMPVVYVDRFGNVVLDVTAEALSASLGRPPGEAGLQVRTETGVTSGFHRAFVEAGPGEPFLLVNSSGYLEIAVRGGRADETLGLRRGSIVDLLAQAGDGR